MSGYIKLYRKMQNWGWYKDPNTKAVFLDIILMAQYQNEEYLGMKLDRGQCFTTLEKLAERNGLTKQHVRTAIKHLISTHDITYTSTHKGLVINVENYTLYQGDYVEPNTQPNTQPNGELTREQHATNTQLTPFKKYKNINNNNNIKKDSLEREIRERESGELLKSSHEMFAGIKAALREASN